MAKTHKKPHQTKPTSTNFLGCCFGYSSKASDQKSVDETIRSDGRKKTRNNSRWYSWYKFRMKKSGAKTVPVESTLSEKPNSKNKFPALKLKSKSSKLATSKPRARVNKHKPPSQIPVAVPVASDHQAPQEKPEETTNGPARNINLEKRDHAEHASKDDTYQKRSSFCRKIEAIRCGSSQPGSPEAKPKPTRPAAISHSASLTVSFPEKRVANPSSTISRGTLKKPAPKRNELAEKRDPVVGLSIIMVTLIIMLFWGRVCAILCTSAWFYFVPRLRNVTKSDDVVGKNPNSHDPDYDSGEYKRKVVLEGFLERNHRIG